MKDLEKYQNENSVYLCGENSSKKNYVGWGSRPRKEFLIIINPSLAFKIQSYFYHNNPGQLKQIARVNTLMGGCLIQLQTESIIDLNFASKISIDFSFLKQN